LIDEAEYGGGEEMTSQRTQRNWLLGSRLFLLFLALAAPAMAQKQDATELAKKTQNPVADLISVPLQSNFNFGAGVNHNKMIYALNVQPVIPIKLTEEWNLITRVIMPIINQPNLSPSFGGLVPSTTGTGLGDFNPSFFFSPAKPGEVIWGLGPTFTLPTATDRNLGAGKLSMGPTGVALTIQGHWVFGALMNNQWSVGGWGDKPVNALLLQPFVNYNLPDGWYLAGSPVITANWKADKAGDVWTVPVGGGVGKVFHIGNQAMNAQLQALGNVARPEFGPKWQLRFQIQFLFPK
jgi:hypothetical protein